MPYYSGNDPRTNLSRAAGSGTGVTPAPHWFSPLSQLSGGFGTSPAGNPTVTGPSTQAAINQPRGEGPIPGHFPQSGPSAGAGTAGGAPGAPPPGQQSPTGPTTTGQDASTPNPGTGSSTRAPLPGPVTAPPPGGPPTQPQTQLTPDITTQLAGMPVGQQSQPDMAALLQAVAQMLQGGITGGNVPVNLGYQAPAPAPTYNGQPLSSYPQAPAPAAPPQSAPAPSPVPAPRPGTRTTTPATQRAPTRTTTPAAQPRPGVVTAQPAPAPAPSNIGAGFQAGAIPGVVSDANRAAYQQAMNQFIAGNGPPPNPAQFGMSGGAAGVAGTVGSLGGQGLVSYPGGFSGGGLIDQLGGWTQQLAPVLGF